MIFRRGSDGSNPLGGDPVARQSELRRHQHAAHAHFATGTLACPRCDAPIALTDGPLTLRDALACPFCDHAAAVRDFLSLGAPTRPTRVCLRVVRRARPVAA